MSKIKVVITGANGLLGQYLIRDMAKAGFEVFATSRGAGRLPDYEEVDYTYASIDIRDKEAVQQYLLTVKPAIIIHAAAMAQPDACELNKDECRDINITATENITGVAEKLGAHLIYVSTDFVFSGDNGPYREDDTPAPVNYYGESKLASEKIIQSSKTSWAIVRTVLVYGNILSGTRSNVVTWVKDNLEKGNHIKVVNDQVRTPTYVEDLSRGIVLIAQQNAKGIFNISGKEVFTPYEMAVQVADYFGLDKSLMEKVTADTFTQPARRPLKTGFIIDKAEKELGYKPVSFKEGIQKMFG
ncbi:MAG: NAD(P)-dependent oxidoreductase [Sphingobacteriales bacterium 40-81]|nr:MAG: NAD(P)-dependent oxidoreductase [Sphingobacteriales bacterium 40-81]